MYNHVLALSQQVRHEVTDSYFIDGQNSNNSNWMSLINTARHEGEQNVIAYQYLGKVYCRTIKSIYPASELLGGYGKQYVKELGMDTNTEGKSFINIHGVLIIKSIILFSQLQLPIFVALVVENPSQLQLLFIST